MTQRYFVEPYSFLPPYPHTWLCRLAQPFWAAQLRSQDVRRVQYRGLEHIKASLAQHAGILIAPNHSAWVDATVVGQLGVQIKQFFFYLVAAHIFRQSRFWGDVLNKLGSFSINREANDLEAIRACVQLLVDASRPLVIFPEGTWTRQNERVGIVQDGVGLIARQAAKQSERPVVIHPVAIKYWLLHDPVPAIERRLQRIEQRITLKPGRGMPLVERIERLLAAYLSVQESQYLGSARTGGQDERIAHLVDAIIAQCEKKLQTECRGGEPLERIRWLRQRLVKRLAECPLEVQGSVRDELDSLLFCENLAGNSAAYLRERPSPERLAEAVQRLEETMFDAPEKSVCPIGAVIEVGPAMNVNDFPKAKGRDRAAGDPLVQGIQSTIQSMLDAQVQTGPPPGWVGSKNGIPE